MKRHSNLHIVGDGKRLKRSVPPPKTSNNNRNTNSPKSTSSSKSTPPPPSNSKQNSDENIPNTAPAAFGNVHLILYNFNEILKSSSSLNNVEQDTNHFQHRFTQLKEHWNSQSINNRFKYQFSQVATIDGTQQDDTLWKGQLFTNPFDVKISHTHQVVIVVDNILRRILFFDVDSLELYHVLSTPKQWEANSLELEVNYCGKGGDALYVSFEGRLIKYDLEKLLESMELSLGQVWMQDNFDFPTSMVVSYGSKAYNSKHDFSENTLYVCDGKSDCIAILEACTGEPLTMIEFNFKGTPQCIDFLNNRLLVVSLYESIIILEMDLITGWKCIQKIEVTDPTSGCTYLKCDQHVDSNTIIATTRNGLELINARTGEKQLQPIGTKANAIALDGKYLYYCIPDNKSIVIFE